MLYPNICSQLIIISRKIIVTCMLSALALMFVGCSSETPPSSAEMKKIEKVELHFSLDQCQPIDSNIYKCPAVDKPVCNPDYNGSLDCVRIGPKGSVFVERGIGEP